MRRFVLLHARSLKGTLPSSEYVFRRTVPVPDWCVFVHTNHPNHAEHEEQRLPGQ